MVNPGNHIRHKWSRPNSHMTLKWLNTGTDKQHLVNIVLSKGSMKQCEPMVAFCARLQTSCRRRTQNATSTACTSSWRSSSCSWTEPAWTVASSQCNWLVHAGELADSRRTSRHTAMPLLPSGGWNVTVAVSTLYCTSAGRSSVSAKQVTSYTHVDRNTATCASSINTSKIANEIQLASVNHQIY